MKLQSLIVPVVFSLAANIMAATVPGAPTNVTVVAWPFTVLVSFTPPADNGGAAITSYTASGVGAAWVTGTAPLGPIMVQGGWGSSPNTFTVTATNSAGTGPASAPSNPIHPIETSNAGDTSPNVYVNGVFYWAGDYDFEGNSYYADTTGHPASGPYDMMFNMTSTGQGAWQPYAPGNLYNLTPYTYMELDLKPTVANKTWDIYYEVYPGDVRVGASLALPGTYGPTPVAGQWAHYKIPIADFNLGTPTIYKFALHDHTAMAPNVTYANNVRYTKSTSAVGSRTAPAASVNRSMIATVTNRTINFTVKNAGTVTVYDLVGNRLAMLHTTGAGLSWTSKAAGAFLVRFAGAGATGAVETQRILVK